MISNVYIIMPQISFRIFGDHNFLAILHPTFQNNIQNLLVRIGPTL